MTQPRGTRPGQAGSVSKGAARRAAPRRAGAPQPKGTPHPKAAPKAGQVRGQGPAGQRRVPPAGARDGGSTGRPAQRPTRPARPERGPEKRASAPRPPGGRKPKSLRLGTASPRRRMRVMVVAVLFVFSIFAAQLLRLQGFDAAATSADALSSRTAKVPIPAMRGRILDSQGTVLASSIERRTVTVDQTAVAQYKKSVNGVYQVVGAAGAAADLAPLVGMSAAELTPVLTGHARYRVVAKNITPLNWRKISALGIPGIYSEPTPDRNYPTSTAAASLVGFLRSDGSAGAGVEVMLDKSLSGKDGHTVYEQALDGRVIPTGHQQTTPAVPGRDVKLTINSDLQWFAQNALAQKVIQTNALSGTVVVQNVRTGELLAVASYPTFDPNQPGQSQDNWTNKAFNEVYEPGSTAKVMTASAAIEEGVVSPSTVVEVPNRIRRNGTEFKDSHDHPTEYLTFAGVLAQSSNIGTVLAGEQMKATTLHDYFYRFGLGQTSGMGFPGEGEGLLEPVKDWDGSQRYTIMYGQGVSVNALQATGVFQTIANGGVRIPPRLIADVGDGKGGWVKAEPAKPVRVVSAKTAKTVRDMLEGVVGNEGTAPEAKIPGYRVAGKTGTADRYDPKQGRYSGKTASFIGFAPADDPQLVVSVTLQRPIKGYFGGVVAGPVFRDVMTYALQELKIPPTNTKPPKVRIKEEETPAKDDPTVLRDRKSGGVR